MSFGAELIGFSLALGTNDGVVTGERSIVVSGEQFVRVTQAARCVGRRRNTKYCGVSRISMLYHTLHPPA